MRHYTDKYYQNPTHKLKVLLVGVGGTGSHVLTNLARINATLEALQHPGLHVCVVDDDKVSESNVGRQMFSPSDIGRAKGEVLIERINRHFNLNWEAETKRYKDQKFNSNIMMSCVDNMETRLRINDNFAISDKSKDSKEFPVYSTYTTCKYWMDFGNSSKTGQVVLGSANVTHKGMKNHKTLLPTVFDMFPKFLKQKDNNNEHSCSVAESINKQDLFVNSLLAQLGCNIIWKLIKDGVIDYHGAFLNLDTLTVKSIKV